MTAALSEPDAPLDAVDVPAETHAIASCVWNNA